MNGTEIECVKEKYEQHRDSAQRIQFRHPVAESAFFEGQNIHLRLRPNLSRKILLIVTLLFS